MRRLFAFLLIGCMCFGMAACNNNSSNGTTGTNGSITASTPNESFPDATVEVLQYLNDKYDSTFTCVGFSSDNTVYHCTSSDYDGVILVYTVESLLEDGYDADDFDGKYADNGYYLVAQDEIQAHYEQYFVSFGEHKLFVYMTASVLPSAVNGKTNFATNLANHPAYFVPTLFLLTENDVTEEDMGALKTAFESHYEQVNIHTVSMKKKDWNDVTIEQLYWSLDDFTVTHSLTTMLDTE